MFCTQSRSEVNVSHISLVRSYIAIQIKKSCLGPSLRRPVVSIYFVIFHKLLYYNYHNPDGHLIKCFVFLCTLSHIKHKRLIIYFFTKHRVLGIYPKSCTFLPDCGTIIYMYECPFLCFPIQLKYIQVDRF